MAQVIYGSEVSKDIRAQLSEQMEALRSAGARMPKLAVILVGNNPASLSYVTGKEKACAQVGMESELIKLPEATTQDELMAVVHRLNEDPTVDGILCQLPLPQGLDSAQVIREIRPDKDVDGFHPINVGKLHLKEDGFVPCTPLGCMELLHRMGINPSGKRAVVLGRSNLVGAPVARLLLNENATVTICHSKTENLPQVCAEADILIAAVGRAKMVTAEYVKKGAAVIDVGINRNDEGKLVGDVDFASVESKAGFITPVPKGVGPMTITMLLKNTLKAYHQHEGK
ncbi:bifunctional methylenetetrahydrofolate dehydrogenase/methenyltetrahydrofolate cyclohydrolase FolD [Holdemania massiliensis]|uniref:bifunctional methylenetetrahydrofolate dehydrogenase/methenyltetrahydrofolate cyclohydrolase FolD n=1 Tax=Holdemania massiliensis TaxID=1468449 RepID=UPI001F06F78E|nr:bifunctional methylenetetrahydrofolate dehydrogenase/methenyltetrahydrofolate cyclohydrolase FolD [Holdemania massiliensis]MCH1942582.1 bifunctional methylenetetrahydrofolate dehydrogenase/methenyltetrahydrofolate cyclohydrolase FolD [Holdemania massiliensis]